MKRIKMRFSLQGSFGMLESSLTTVSVPFWSQKKGTAAVFLAKCSNNSEARAVPGDGNSDTW